MSDRILRQHGAIHSSFTGPRISRRRLLALTAIGIGLAHFAVPALFDPINELAFPLETRLHTYINGGVQTGFEPVDRPIRVCRRMCGCLPAIAGEGMDRPANKPLKLTAAGFSYAEAALDTIVVGSRAAAA